MARFLDTLETDCKMTAKTTTGRAWLEVAAIPFEFVLEFFTLQETLLLCTCCSALRDRLLAPGGEQDYIWKKYLSLFDPFASWKEGLSSSRGFPQFWKQACIHFKSWPAFFGFLAQPKNHWLGPNARNALICSPPGVDSAFPVVVTRCMRVNVVVNPEGEGIILCARHTWEPMACSCNPSLPLPLPETGTNTESDSASQLVNFAAGNNKEVSQHAGHPDFPHHCSECKKLVGGSFGPESAGHLMIPLTDGRQGWTSANSNKMSLTMVTNTEGPLVTTTEMELSVPAPATTATTTTAQTAEPSEQIEDVGPDAGPGAPEHHPANVADLLDILRAAAAADDHDEGKHEKEDDDEDDVKNNDENEKTVDLTIRSTPLSPFAYSKLDPAMPVVSSAAALLHCLSDESLIGCTVAVSGAITLRGQIFEMDQPIKLLGIPDLRGRQPVIRIVMVEGDEGQGEGGTLMVNAPVMLEGLHIISCTEDFDVDTTDFDSSEHCFPAIEVLEGAQLFAKDVTVTAMAGTAVIVSEGSAWLKDCVLSSYCGSEESGPSFLGLVARSNSTVCLYNCDLSRNLWGCSLGADLSAERECVVRKLNTMAAGDAGISRMYKEYTGSIINPWD